jgi:hypothetical protein
MSRAVHAHRGTERRRTQALALIEELPAEVVMADTAYDAGQLRQAIAAAQRENAAPAQKGQKHCEWCDDR